MHMTVSIRLDDGQIVSARGPLEGLTDDEVSITAANLAYGLVEEVYAVLAEGE